MCLKGELSNIWTSRHVLRAAVKVIAGGMKTHAVWHTSALNVFHFVSWTSAFQICFDEWFATIFQLKSVWAQSVAENIWS
jgi:hypothetical protein